MVYMMIDITYYYYFRDGDVVESITRETTPDVFDNILSMYQGFNLNQTNRNGHTVLTQAAKVGNVTLVKHIVSLPGGAALLNSHSIVCLPPLACAASNQNIVDGFNTSRELMRLGAKVNYEGIPGILLTSTIQTIEWNKPLVKLLLRHGAIENPNLKIFFPPVPRRIEETRKELQKEQAVEMTVRIVGFALLYKFTRLETNFSKMPKDIAKIIINMVKYAQHWQYEKLP